MSKGRVTYPLKSVTKEATVLAHCKRYLEFLRAQGKLTFRRIHTTGIPRGRDGHGRVRFSKNVDMGGMADFLIFLPKGLVLHVEAKASRGVLTDRQKEWRKELESLGHPYIEVRCLDDLVEALHGAGVVDWSTPLFRAVL